MTPIKKKSHLELACREPQNLCVLQNLAKYTTEFDHFLTWKSQKYVYSSAFDLIWEEYFLSEITSYS